MATSFDWRFWEYIGITDSLNLRCSSEFGMKTFMLSHLIIVSKIINDVFVKFNNSLQFSWDKIPMTTKKGISWQNHPSPQVSIIRNCFGPKFHIGHKCAWRGYCSMWLCCAIGDEERVEHIHSHHMQLAQHFFPSSICGAALPIIHLMEDLEVNADGVAGRWKATKILLWGWIRMQGNWVINKRA